MILLYHNLAELAGFYTVAEEQFRKQVAWIHLNLNPMSIDEYVSKVKTDSLNKEDVVISFDDALLSYRDWALPALQEYNLASVLYVPTGHVGRENSWDSVADQGGTAFPILSWEELRKIKENPLVTLASHGVSHRSFGSLSAAEMEAEIANSKEELQKQLGKVPKHFSFPYGQSRDCPAKAIDYLKSYCYESAASTLWDLRNRPKDLYSLNRIEIAPDDAMPQFIKKCSRRYHQRFFKSKVKSLIFN